MKVLYLSCAPRVSTKAISSSHGPRTHVLGVMGAFEQLRFSVDKLIIGDIVPESMITANFEPQKEGSVVKRTLLLIASDIVRFLIRIVVILQGIKIKKSNRPDLVYERYGLFMGLGNFFKKPQGIWILESNAVLSQESSGDRSTMFFNNWARKSEAKAYRKCDYLVVVTEELKQLIINAFNILPSKIIVVSNGVDSNRFNPEIKEVVRPQTTSFVLGFVGSLMPWQHLQLPIRVVTKLRNEGLDIAMTIVGDGAERVDLKSLVLKLEAEDYITFTGSVDWQDIPSYINGFDACYSGPLPLTSGKMYLSPLKLYEYLAMDKLVVASNYPDAVNLLTGELASCLFLQNDEESLAELLRKLVRKDVVANFDLLGKKVREELSWTAKVRSLLKTLGLT
ncbi:MAG: glycosyltransferase involved in cell wall biosynthesis [Alteromonas macleodii]|jgi:glycosyltransferase involved in cell wall biosynthesis